MRTLTFISYNAQRLPPLILGFRCTGQKLKTCGLLLFQLSDAQYNDSRPVTARRFSLRVTEDRPKTCELAKSQSPRRGKTA